MSKIHITSLEIVRVSIRIQFDDLIISILLWINQQKFNKTNQGLPFSLCTANLGWMRRVKIT